MIKCKFCQREFEDRRSFSLHVHRMHSLEFNDKLEIEEYIVYTLFGRENVEMCVTEYQNEKYCIAALPIDISKLLMLRGLKRTSKEERKTKRYKDKYLTAIRNKYGDEGITNISQVEEVQKKKEDTLSKKYGSYEKYLSECRKKMNTGYESYCGTEKHKNACKNGRLMCLIKYGHENFGNGKNARERRNSTLKETIDSWSYEERLERTSAARESVCHRGGYSSKPEKRVRHALTELDIDFQTNVHKWHYNFDMVFEKYIIEVQGDMWHANPKFYKSTDLIMGKLLAEDLWKKDKRKRKKAELEGYIVIEIWEDDISKRRNDDDLIIFVKQKLIDNGYYN